MVLKDYLSCQVRFLSIKKEINNLATRLILPPHPIPALGVQTPSPDNDDVEDSDDEGDEEGKNKKSAGVLLDPSSIRPSPHGTPSVENSGEAEPAAKEDQVLLDANIEWMDRLINIWIFVCFVPYCAVLFVFYPFWNPRWNNS